jgi:hypothetical protein
MRYPKRFHPFAALTFAAMFGKRPLCKAAGKIGNPIACRSPPRCAWRSPRQHPRSNVEARPERMHEDFRALAVEAMQKAWPCK